MKKKYPDFELEEVAELWKGKNRFYEVEIENEKEDKEIGHLTSRRTDSIFL